MRLRSLFTSRWITRAWYYFRLGYSTYLTFLLGYVSTLITVYYLAIKNAPELLGIFPHFGPFAVLATVIGGPLAIIIGWVHLKRSSLFSSETDIAIESNPYVYKLQPGIVKEVQIPVMLMELRLVRRLADTRELLTVSEKAEVDELEKKMLTLLQGGFVGAPRRRKWAT